MHRWAFAALAQAHGGRVNQAHADTGQGITGGAEAGVALSGVECGELATNTYDVGVFLAVQVAELANDDVGALGKALQGFAQGWQHDVGRVAQSAFDAVEQLPEYRAMLVNQQMRCEPA